MTSRRRKNSEYVIFSSLILAACLLSMAAYINDGKLYRERLMQSELATLRLGALSRYYDANMSYPSDLNTLVEVICANYGACILTGGDDVGLLTDPFGNRYFYSGENGWVMSKSMGYYCW